MKFLAVADLVERWCYTKAGIHKLIRRSDFPKPFAVVCRGRIKIFEIEMIKNYEISRPWLFDESAKRQRVIGYCLAVSKGYENETNMPN